MHGVRVCIWLGRRLGGLPWEWQAVDGWPLKKEKERGWRAAVVHACLAGMTPETPERPSDAPRCHTAPGRFLTVGLAPLSPNLHPSSQPTGTTAALNRSQSQALLLPLCRHGAPHGHAARLRSCTPDGDRADRLQVRTLPRCARCSALHCAKHAGTCACSPVAAKVHGVVSFGGGGAPPVDRPCCSHALNPPPGCHTGRHPPRPATCSLLRCAAHPGCATLRRCSHMPPAALRCAPPA